jgi:hypothetical protein
MVNILRNNEVDTQDFSWIDLNQPEFQKLLQMTDDFCSKPGLWEWKNKFEEALTSMNLFDIYDLYITRTDMLAWHNIETTNLRARQIEKALLLYIDNKWIDSDELVQLNLSVNTMDDIYKSLKEEYTH